MTRCRPSSVVRCPIQGYRFARRPGWDFDIVRAGTNALGLAGVYLAEDGGERMDIEALLALLGQGNAEVRDRTTDHGSRGTRGKRQIYPALRGTTEVRGQKSEVSLPCDVSGEALAKQGRRMAGVKIRGQSRKSTELHLTANSVLYG